MPLDETPKPARSLDVCNSARERLRDWAFVPRELLVRASDLRPHDLAAAELMDPP
jgi:hypothetical protein